MYLDVLFFARITLLILVVLYTIGSFVFAYLMGGFRKQIRSEREATIVLISQRFVVLRIMSKFLKTHGVSVGKQMGFGSDKDFESRLKQMDSTMRKQILQTFDEYRDYLISLATQQAEIMNDETFSSYLRTLEEIETNFRKAVHTFNTHAKTYNYWVRNLAFFWIVSVFRHHAFELES